MLAISLAAKNKRWQPCMHSLFLVNYFVNFDDSTRTAVALSEGASWSEGLNRGSSPIKEKPSTVKAHGACKIRLGWKVLQVPKPYYTFGGDILSLRVTCLIPVFKSELCRYLSTYNSLFVALHNGTRVIYYW